MRLRDRVRRAGGSFALVVVLATGCTVFNGKSVPTDAGAVGTDGGASDDASARDSASANDCGCTGSNHVLCESFEAPLLGVTWSRLGDVTPHDTTRAHCGSGSLRVRTPAVAANAQDGVAIQTDQLLRDPRLSGGFYSRAWVYLPSAADLVGFNYFTLLEVRQAADPFLGAGVQINRDQSTLVNWTATPAAFVGSGAAFPRDTWTCVEWQIVFGKGTGATNVWIGGAEKPTIALDATDTAPTPAYADVLLGAFVGTGGEAQPSFDLYVDDVAFDDKRIGCAP